MKRVLIVGANSFVGNAVRDWLSDRHKEDYSVDVIDALDQQWKQADFTKYDVLYQVAGIAHVKTETEQMRQLFFDVNAGLTEQIASAAKEAGIAQYIFMSTKGVYDAFVPFIDETTQTNPPKLYGQSKLAGEEALRRLESDTFHVSIIRAPAIYGKNAPGSYSQLLKRIDSLRVFPAYRNRRSLIYIDNLCEFIHLVISRELYGILVPQDAEYLATVDIVRYGAKYKNRKILFDYVSWPLIAILSKLTYKFKKPFGSTVYKHNFSINDRDYYVCDLETAVRRSIME